MLSTSQIKQFERDGYIVVDDVLTASEIAALRGVVEEFVEKSRELTENSGGLILEPTHTSAAPKLQRIDHPVKAHAAFDAVMRSPSILDTVADLIGPDIRYHHSKINMKTAGVGSPVEWHQDYAFFPHTNDDVVAVGLALDDCSLENGCLLVVPGSHRIPLLDHHQDGAFVGAVPVDSIDQSQVVPVIVPAGGMSIHHSRTLHASAPNRSNRPRRLFLIEYAAADAWPVGVKIDPEEFYSRVVRGEPTRRARMMHLEFDMRQPGSARSLYELQANLKQSAFGT